jgi:3-oxoacyl-[acyl-carrier protein] reductase
VIDLKGKTAVVTGGSRGIGRATSLLMARAGAGVAFGYRENHTAARSLIQEIRAEGHRAVAQAGDITRPETVEALFTEARRNFGGIDIVVGNAGIWKRSPIDELTEGDWEETLAVNLRSAFLLCRAAAREMKPQRSGKIVLVSSTAGQRGEAFHAHYAASKGAIIALTKSLAAELGPWNIRVNAVAPGWVTTDMTSEVFRNPELRASIEEAIPLGRVAVPQDVAGPILFLASDLANHVQGEILNVNGGSVLCG